MRELSLHILDLVENSIRAGARHVAVALEQDPARDRLLVMVDDDGPGLCVPAKDALDPFYTTKPGKHTGLGLSLFRAAAERANGELSLLRSPLGGLRVQARFQLRHVDRAPIGDLGVTLSSIACTNPEIELACTVRVLDRSCVVTTEEVRAECAATSQGNDFVTARLLAERIQAGLTQIGALL